MNKPILEGLSERNATTLAARSITTGPLPASQKKYDAQTKAPWREIALTNGEFLRVYDPSGP